ncbi:glucan endo-1,3-beta-glucosidase 2 [Ricinus communis]|uniref:glucan endo-1,3-beta-glucosidase 2 n=1 Tax=Ricinus communis TaxID=3988 RepID=UPI00077274F8|nr:glucan endo-1,3-beta-glucosidase 2 [Ricinus communis]|eukprot:XP_015581630.1 glucan endo-1,3-beta-glucosidase 2 [Ricinus communis]
MKPLISFLLLLLFPLLLTTTTAVAAHPHSLSTAIGVTYTSPFSQATPSPPPDKIAAAISTLHFHYLRLTNPEPNLIRSFAFTNTSLFLSIPNSFLLPLASNRSLALRWLYGHVLPFYPRSKISVISVGDDAVSSQLAPYLLPAIRNLHLALRDLGIKQISVSTTFSFVNLVTTPFPPSSAIFQEPMGELVIKPLLQFLEETNSSFLVKVYPYNMYRLNSEIPIGFALFHQHPFNFRDDLVTGVRYRNLFDMMVDAVITAMAVAGHQNIPVVVAETGWPSSGGAFREVDASPEFAEAYIKGLVGHLKSGLGTPLRKEGGVKETYIFELADKDVKQQGSKSWGILYANFTKKYSDIDFSSNANADTAVLFLEGICLLIVGLSLF